ncbi:MAG TPA: PAS domain S-box protein [Mycobacterium sp.]|nr:PAS domain S-box protein [Mycobacterium sp.]HUH71831.1 PAS domain S-box protein [Mycobacterium sp.]
MITPEPKPLADALHQRDSELRRVRGELVEARRELEDTNRGLIAVYTELDAARHAEARLAAIVRSSDDAIISMTPDGVIQTWNPAAQRLLGHPETGIVGQPVRTLLPPESEEIFAQSLQRVRRDEHAQPYDTQWCRADGTLVDVVVTVSALRDTRGELIGFSAVAHDITQRLATQAELATARAEAEVFAERERIARDLHDHVIQGVFAVGLGLQGLVARSRSADMRQRLTAAVDALHGVIQDVRTVIFQLHGGSAGVTRLRQRLDEAIAKLSGDLHTIVRYSGPLSVVDAALADHAEAVVKEAISNAVRHAEATKLTITVDVADQLCIDVVDNGKGIPDNITGSGLVNLRQRAEAVVGTFTIHDGPGGGTRLRWSAPLP